MSGRIVPMLGGPMDGRERHRAFSTGGSEEVTFAAAAIGVVHVYTAERAPDAPFAYQGIRAWRSGDSAWPLLLEWPVPGESDDDVC